MGETRKVLVRRRRANTAGGRTHQLHMRLSLEEWAALSQAAAAKHVTVQRLLVESALSGGAELSTERRDLIAELFRLERLVAGVANNLNQIAKATNATGEWQPATAAMVAYSRQMYDRLDTLIDELAAR